jgi:hypothetical protein
MSTRDMASLGIRDLPMCEKHMSAKLKESVCDEGGVDR